MSKLQIGDKVELKFSHAKWHLEHLEIYCVGDSQIIPEKHEEEIQLHLVCCLGESVPGKVVTTSGLGNYLVDFKVGNLRANFYVGRKHVTKIK